MSASKRNLIHPSPDPVYLTVESETGNGYRQPIGLTVSATEKKSGEKDKKRKLSKGSANNNYRVWTQDLEALTFCDQFFLKQTNLELSANLSSNYDVRNGKGQLVFKAVESIDPVVRDQHQLKKTKPPFVLSIFDMKAGKEMLCIKTSLGHGIMLVYVKQVNNDDKIIGIIRRVKSRCCCKPANYYLERPNGTVLLKIKSSMRSCWLGCCTRKRGRSFKIYLADEITYVGSVSGQLRKFDEEEDPNNNVVEAIFPVDTTATNKALLLAAAFMLDFVYFQEGRRPKVKRKISKTCYIVLVIVILVAIIAILAIVVGGRGFQGGGRGGRPGRFSG